MTKKPFQVGDRVRVYYLVLEKFANLEDHTIKSICADGVLELENAAHAHPKQCRRLVKKERKRAWIEDRPEGHWPEVYRKQPLMEGFSEYVEVRRPK